MPLKLVQPPPPPPPSASSGKRRLELVRRFGRMGKLSPAVLQTIVHAVSVGSSAEVASQAAGVTSRTLRAWRERGANGEAPYSSLVTQMAEAQAARLVRLASIFIKGCEDDPRLALLALERLDPQTWGRPMVVAASVAEAVQQTQALPDWSVYTEEEKDLLERLLDKGLPKRQHLVEGELVDTDEDREDAA